MTDTAPAIDAILAEHADLEHQLSDPNLHSDAGKARKVGRRFAQLAPIVATYRKLDAARGDLEAARELAADDESFAAEMDELTKTVDELDTHLTDLLAPRDPHVDGLWSARTSRCASWAPTPDLRLPSTQWPFPAKAPPSAADKS